MEYNFSHKLRLTTDNQFKIVFRNARKIPTKAGAIFYYNNKLNHPRLGIVVPKKSIRKANDRNYFKRIVREGFRLRQHELKAIDIIFLAYRDAGYMSRERLRQWLKNQLENLVLRSEKL